jgi:hypothetical protein
MRQPSLRLHQLTQALDERFKPYVHRRGINEENPDENRLRSRALAAMAGHMVSRIPDREAAARVTDYYHDDDIDGFAIERAEPEPPTIYLIQAKWSAEGKHNFKEDEVTDLYDGLEKLLKENGTHPVLHRQNPLRDHWKEILKERDRVGARFVLVWATSGRNKPSPGVEQVVAEKNAGFAEEGLSVEGRFILLPDFIRDLEAEVARKGVTVSGGLLRSRKVDEQHESLQGTISAAELGKWYGEHERRLFDDNVRVEMTSEVNREIVKCLLEEPENFWYFNNGVTALCEDWDRAPANVREVPFRFDGLRIVNGAQTVSSINKAMGEPEKVAKAQVPIRFIKLKTTGAEFGARIAFATNRTNAMLPRDLLAMDHVQQRLRDEFKLTWGFTYAIRANDDLPAAASGCSVLEAVIAMASGRLDISSLVAARDDIESLWPDNRDCYEKLFDDTTSVVEVWRRVLILRLIMDELHTVPAHFTQREKAVAALGDLVIAYSVFRRLGNEGIGDIASRWEERLHEVSRYTRAAGYALVEKVDAELTAKPASGNNFNGVSALLRNKRWLAKRVPEISADDWLEPSSRKGAPAAPWSSAPEFYLNIGSALQAKGRRCDGGFLVYAGSAAAAKDHSSLSTPQLRYRRNLRDSLGFVPQSGYLRMTRDTLFASPSQAAGVLQGHSVNGRGEWVTADGLSYNQVVTTKNTPGHRGAAPSAS